MRNNPNLAHCLCKNTGLNVLVVVAVAAATEGSNIGIGGPAMIEGGGLGKSTAQAFHSCHNGFD